MAISLYEFKKQIKEYLLEIHWKQWSALGVASHVQPEQYWHIDVEALIISTLTIGLHDKRLFSACIEWLIQNSEWVNFSRLKRIAKLFSRPLPVPGGYLFNQGILSLLFDTLKKFKRFVIKYPDFIVTDNMPSEEYKKVFEGFKIRGIANQLQIFEPIPHLQLLLRGYFGVDARVEVLMHLLVDRAGNSNAIAKDVFHNQRNIYTILEKWLKVQIVKKVNAEYSLNKKKEWLRVLGLKKNIPSVNWSKTFLLSDQLLKSFSITELPCDKYTLSSIFRDFYKDAAVIGDNLNLQIPEPSVYKGEQYFEPFAVTVLTILKSLMRRS